MWLQASGHQPARPLKWLIPRWIFSCRFSVGFLTFDVQDAESIQQQLDVELKRLFQHFEEDEERTSRLAIALEQESTAAALHFALFPRRTRDGGLQAIRSYLYFSPPFCLSSWVWNRENVKTMFPFLIATFDRSFQYPPLCSLHQNWPYSTLHGIIMIKTVASFLEYFAVLC